MQLVRRQETWDPFREMETLSNRLNRLFGMARTGNGEREHLATTDWAPACDIVETDKTYQIQAELPGVNKDDVHVTLADGVLTIQGQRREVKEEKTARFHRRELAFGNFLRRFTMPDDADESKVDASFKDGILEVVINKAKAKASKTKEIEVH